MQLPQAHLSSQLSKCLFGTLALLTFTSAARAQATTLFNFSVDWHGPTVGMPDSAFAFPITEGDILRPVTGLPAFGPLAKPSIQYSAGFAPVPGLGLAMHAPCAGHPGGTPCAVEVDALDYGRALKIAPGMALKGRVMFSVDRFAGGGGAAVPPNVLSESAGGVFEASADVFVGLGLTAGPLPPFAAPLPGNTAVVDGNGMLSPSGFTYRGVGLMEPNPPGGGPAAPGDNLDALAITLLPGALAFPPAGIWFSLDSAFMDPLTAVANTGSAAAHGFVGGDVLHVAAAGGPPAMYAPAPVLGLAFGGPDASDLDALVISENGVAGYQPSVVPNDWAAGGTDMLLFSVRRGSAIIGLPDSIFGMPITEGDILTTPLPAALGGVSPFPGIYIAAENLGLATVRMPPPAAGFSADLDALELPQAPLFDCNGNGIEDAYDIATGGATDVNKNGVPDSCELFATSYCFCPAPIGPCGNNDPTAGCKNSTGLGGKLGASGTSSVASDNLVLSGTQLPPVKPGLLLQGGSTIAPLAFFDGARCVNGPIFRHAPMLTSATGTATNGPGLAAYSVGNFGAPGWITPGSIWYFQFWHRDTAAPCGTHANLTNAVKVTFTP
ncbi:MAG TPA: hypothetical protein VM509_13215 [Planctomycetota bacterium]|nr:hypothetical protein [Planctomycetota bacterium]